MPRLKHSLVRCFPHCAYWFPKSVFIPKKKKSSCYNQIQIKQNIKFQQTDFSHACRWHFLWQYNDTVQWNSDKGKHLAFTQQHRFRAVRRQSQSDAYVALWLRPSVVAKKWLYSKLGQKQAGDFLLLCRNRPANMYMLKWYFLLGVITRGRSNLVPDQTGDWVCGFAVLEVRASGSWWTAIDWGERGDTVAVAQHWFSASAVVESRQNERAGPGGAARLSSQISGSFFFFLFFFLYGTDLPWVKEIYLFRH